MSAFFFNFISSYLNGAWSLKCVVLFEVILHIVIVYSPLTVTVGGHLDF